LEKEFLERKDATRGYAVISSVWRSLPESEMRAVLVVVANILREQAFQVAFVNCNDVIQEDHAGNSLPNALQLHSAKDFRTKCGQDSPSGIEPLRGLPVHTWHHDQR
jgi:hypothetical protein